MRYTPRSSVLTHSPPVAGMSSVRSPARDVRISQAMMPTPAIGSPCWSRTVPVSTAPRASEIATSVSDWPSLRKMPAPERNGCVAPWDIRGYPGFSAVTVNLPDGSSLNEKRPSSSVSTERSRRMSPLTLTLARRTGAPSGSRTTPAIAPVPAGGCRFCWSRAGACAASAAALSTRLARQARTRAAAPLIAASEA